MLKRMMLLGVVMTGLFTVFGSLLAQSNETILTIGVEAWQADMLNERVLQGFYDTHPGVKIVPIVFNGDEAYYGFDTSDVEGSLDKAEAYFSSADVVPAHNYNLFPIYTRAGYVLDLTPFIRADGSGTVDDFQPIALNLFNWDNGTWALPISISLNFISYNVDAFDAAGYPHPDSSWMLDDYLDAARALTVRDNEGNVTLPGFYGYDQKALIRTLSGKGFYDSSTSPETVRLDDPDIEAMLEALDAYDKELMGDDPDNMAMQNWDWSKIPLQMGGSWLLDDGIKKRGNSDHFEPVLMPDGGAMVSGEGFAISAGTPHPDLAYELVTYLTGNIEVVSRYYTEIPVRHALEGQTTEDGDTMSPPDAVQDILPQIMENGISWSELRYGEYLDAALAKMKDDETITLHEALQQAQEQAVSDFQLAEARKSTPVVVSTPVPTPVLSAGEVALKFAMIGSYSSVSKKDEWDRIAKEFMDSDPEVGYVEIQSDYVDLSEQLKEIDCAYTSYNYIPSLDLSLIQPLDAFISTDSSFDRSDIPSIVWSQVTRDDQVYGLPMTLVPMMMWYDPRAFEAAGAFPPEMGWSISDFIDAMTMLKNAQPDKKPYRSQNYGNAPYVLLAAGLGGVAIDYSTFMPTYHLTDPAVIEALRQTLDLAKEGYIDYAELDSDTSGLDVARAVIVGGDGEVEGPALYDAPGYISSWDDIGTEDSPQLPVTFPRGSDLVPLAFDVGAAYISAQTPYADACYRWLSTIALHPELFTETPARSSLAASDALIASQGQRASDFYVGMFDLMNSPEAVLVPAGLGAGNSSPGAYIADIWFNRALDSYVLESGDLETSLTDAQSFIDDYRQCTADFGSFDFSGDVDEDEWSAYYKQFTDCAVSVDPSLADRFAEQSGG